MSKKKKTATAEDLKTSADEVETVETVETEALATVNDEQVTDKKIESVTMTKNYLFKVFVSPGDSTPIVLSAGATVTDPELIKKLIEMGAPIEY